MLLGRGDFRGRDRRRGSHGRGRRSNQVRGGAHTESKAEDPDGGERFRGVARVEAGTAEAEEDLSTKVQVSGTTMKT